MNGPKREILMIFSATYTRAMNLLNLNFSGTPDLHLSTASGPLRQQRAAIRLWLRSVENVIGGPLIAWVQPGYGSNVSVRAHHRDGGTMFVLDHYCTEEPCLNQ